MPLVTCPDCEKRISSRVQQCPFCGCPAEFFIKDKDDNNSIIPQNVTESASPEFNKTQEEYNPTYADLICDNSDEKDELVIANESDNNDSDIILKSSKNTSISSYADDESVVFGVAHEKYPINNRLNYDVILDPQRECDLVINGIPRVAFKLGKLKYVSVSKDDLFYAPLYAEIEAITLRAEDIFDKYLNTVTDLNGLTTGASDCSIQLTVAVCKFLIEKLIAFNIFDYDESSFARLCGDKLFIENSRTYAQILNQIQRVEEFSQELSYQRQIERSSRSQWVGGGFGLKGAIKGAVTAGALNTATGLFRSIGDGLTNAADHSNVQSKYKSIINDENLDNLSSEFSSCLSVATDLFYKLLGEKTGWSPNGVLWNDYEKGISKLTNLEQIKDDSIKEQLLTELLSTYPFLNGAINYILDHYREYNIERDDLIHYVRRLNPVALEDWVITGFNEVIDNLEQNYTGNKLISELVDYGITFSIIDKDFNILNTILGGDFIFHTFCADMANEGYNLEDVKDLKNNFDFADDFFEQISKVGSKYHILSDFNDKKELELLPPFDENDSFVQLINDLNKHLKEICTVRGIKCNSIQEAKVLTHDWKIFDEEYSPYNSYADYDSKAMQEVIDNLESKKLKSDYINKKIWGRNGLSERKAELEKRENTEDYKKSQQIINRLIEMSNQELFVYGSDGFIEKAKKVRFFDIISQNEVDAIPIVIYDVSDDNGFKGFVITDKFFYNFNSVLGIGFGDKAIPLNDVRETSTNGKNRTFQLANGKSEKIKIIGYEDQIISVLSDVYIWVNNSAKNNTLEGINSNSSTDNNFVVDSLSTDSTERIPCPSCGKLIKKTSKICTFCGCKIIKNDSLVDTGLCPNCGRLIGFNAKFCTFCGFKKEDLSEPDYVFCNKCGEKYLSTFDFCNKCGAPNVMKPKS